MQVRTNLLGNLIVNKSKMICMNSKAISPMIATILLVAFTVAVGGIISIWMTGYTRTTGASVSSATENVTACVNSYPYITLVTTQAILVTNPGSETITNVRCFAGNGSDISRGGLGSLASGASNTTRWCNATGGAVNYDSGFGTNVVCTAQCRSIGVSGECKRGQSCWTAS